MAGKRAFNAYIDESGCEGWKLDRKVHGQATSSEWLILGAVLIHAEHDRERTGAVHDLREIVKQTQTQRPLHWRKLGNDHFKKRRAADRLNTDDFVYCAAALWKPGLADLAPGLRKPGYLYHYAGRFLIERLSWFADKQGRSVNLLFEKRRQTSYADLEAYVRQIESDPESSIEANSIGVIRPVKPSVKGAQLADYFVGTVRDALELDSHGYTEADYLERLGGRIFCRPGKSVLSYGLKIYPESGLSPDRHPWMRSSVLLSA